MSSHARAHHSPFGPNWSLASVTTALLLMLFFLILLLLFMTITAAPAYGQQSVPPTARQAATMPQFAAKLNRRVQQTPPQIASPAVHPAEPRASYKKPWSARVRDPRGGPLDENEIYDNGPINGTTDAWTLNFGFVTSDTFTASDGDTVNGLAFGAWLFPGDVLQTVEVSFTSQPLGGGTIYSDQVVSFTASGCSGNQYGFNVCTETSANFSGPNLAAGTYWVNLQNAVVNDGDPVYWDENSGPSSALENSVGTIPSEAFTIEGDNCGGGGGNCGPGCAHDENNFNIIHNFNRNEQPPAPGLGIDRAGNAYGSTLSGGEYSFGSAFKLALHAGNWIFTTLYSFLGGASGQSPAPEIVGPDGALYGIADGGIQNCSSYDHYCGVVYRLAPSPNPCLTALCSWTEDVIYTFTGDDNAPSSGLVFDRAGTLYGATGEGGSYGHGTIYKLTPAYGEWTKTTIYSFTGNHDGEHPVLTLLGHDGYLYGTSSAGLFRLMQPGPALKILSSFGCAEVQDSAGNFYCRRSGGNDDNTWGQIYELSYGNWIVTAVEDTYNYHSFYCSDPNLPPCYDVFNSLATDSAGRVYATQGAFYHVYDGRCSRYDFYCDGNIHPVGTYDFLVDFNGDVFRDLEIGRNGSFYGTMAPCGSSGGAVWQLSP